MYHKCYICGEEISPKEIHYTIHGKFLHQSIFTYNNKKRYCYQKYINSLNKKANLNDIKSSGW